MTRSDVWWVSGVGAVLAGWACWSLTLGMRAMRWPAVTGRIIETGVHDYGRGGMTSGRYLPTVRYEYRIAEELLVGSRLSFGLWFLHSSATAAATRLALSAGDVVTVYYNPRRPTDSVLRRGTTIETVGILLIGLEILFVAISDG